MPSKKPDTLSLYLRVQANKFYPFYPQQKEPTRLSLEDQIESRETVNWALEKTLERFLTFVPDSNALQNEHWEKSTVLDDVLCRILLREVPGMVMRIQNLERIKLAQPKRKTEWLAYLQESAKCLIFGLSQASVALARAAVEACLRETHAEFFGKQEAYAQKTTLAILIRDLAKRQPVLSSEEQGWARSVKDAGDKVLHHRPIEAEEALEVFEKARLLIQKKVGRSRIK